MKFGRHLALLAICSTLIAGCQKEVTNKSGLSKETYQPSNSPVIDMTFPAGQNSVFKRHGEFDSPTSPEKYVHPEKWVVYMAATGWTNKGKRITDRVAFDAAQLAFVKNFIRDNRLFDQVKVAWIQYDRNPSSNFVESLDVIPSNFIPLFLKPMGPVTDYYIYSPAERYESNKLSMRYDMWLKPYMRHTKPSGDDYVTESEFHKNNGFDDVNGPYWDRWARHWFIVNPQGQVMDAYLSNMGHNKSYGADFPINSLIYHLDLDSDSLVVREFHQINYQSYYSPPYWEKMHAEFLDTFKR